MKPLAATGPDGRIEQAARLGSNHRRRTPHDRSLASSVRLSASQALAENDAKDSIGDSYAIPWGILKPNIYYKAHNFALEPIGSELLRRKPRQRPAGSDRDVVPTGMCPPRRPLFE
jgi:hypothetical protein